MLSGGVLFGMLGQASTSFIGIGARAIDGLASSEASQAVRRQPDGVHGPARVGAEELRPSPGVPVHNFETPLLAYAAMSAWPIWSARTWAGVR
jgi:hypothetical protein